MGRMDVAVVRDIEATSCPPVQRMHPVVRLRRQGLAEWSREEKEEDDDGDEVRDGRDGCE